MTPRPRKDLRPSRSRANVPHLFQTANKRAHPFPWDLSPLPTSTTILHSLSDCITPGLIGIDQDTLGEFFRFFFNQDNSKKYILRRRIHPITYIDALKDET